MLFYFVDYNFLLLLQRNQTPKAKYYEKLPRINSERMQ